MKTTILRFLKHLYKNIKYLYKIEYRKQMDMPSYLHQVLIGLLLSDGSIEKSSETSLARLSVMFGWLHIAYLFHLYNLFEPYTDSDIRIITTYNKRTNTEHNQVAFKTVSLPIFLKYHKMFYVFDDKSKRYIKIIPHNIEDHMTPVVLAHLIMGDGNLKPKDNIIRIYTNSFSKKDVELLSTSINNKLGIITKVTYDRNNQYILTISKNQLEAVKTMILPYMHKSMLYKLDLNSDNNCFKLENHLEDI